MTTEWTSDDLLSASVGPLLLLRYYEFYYQKLSSLPEEVILAREPSSSSACKCSPRRSHPLPHR